MFLYNRIDRKILQKQLEEEKFNRVTLSFYKYAIIENPPELRDQLYMEWSELDVFGRIYLAHEGINAQLSLPEENLQRFKKALYSRPEFEGAPFKIAVEDDGKSFYKLIVKCRAKLVNDGLEDDSYDVTNVGKHLNAIEINQYLDDPETVIVDMRNHYEFEVGHFENALKPEGATFRDVLPEMVEKLKEKKENRLILYCTGGIRCEKASAYFRNEGFLDVNQIHGGIIDYARQVKTQHLENRYKGKNFVFDERLGEKIGEEIVSKCHQCGEPCDTHVNCGNQDCHILFIQCDNCKSNFNSCCSNDCKEFIEMNEEDKDKLRLSGKMQRNVYLSKQKENYLGKFEHYKP